MTRGSRGHFVALAMACVVGAAACGGGGDATTPAPPPGGAEPWLESWMHRVVEDPARLTPFEQENAIGAGWLALYHNDYAAASAAFEPACTPSDAPLSARAEAGFPCVGLARVRIEQAQTMLASAEIDRIARLQFYKHRTERPEEVLPSRHQAFFYGLLELRAGRGDAGRAMLEGYRAGADADPLLGAVAERVLAGWGQDALVDRIWGGSPDDVPADAPPLALPEGGSPVYRARLAVMEAVARGDLAGGLSALAAARSTEADLLEQLEQTDGAGQTLTVVLHHVDSAYLRSLGRLYALDAARALGGAPELAILERIALQALDRSTLPEAVAVSVVEGLALVVFGSELAPADLLAATTPGSRPASLLRLGAAEAGLLASPAEKLADIDAFIRLVNGLKDRLATRLRDASAAGGNMDAGMGLSDRFHGRLIIDGAVDLVAGMDVRLELEEGKDMATAGVAARSLLELALDKNPSPPSTLLRRGRVSFRNDPPFLLELARANLDTKRPYYANEYVRPLTEVFPELTPVREALTALDSAWNPVRAGAVR